MSDRDEEDDEFFSPSFLIRTEQLVLDGQLDLVEAAAGMFAELRALVKEESPNPHNGDPMVSKMTVAAKAFVFEAATLRLLAVDIARRFPQFAKDASYGLREFDAAMPLLVELRNSQAHFDERLNFRARSKRLHPKMMFGPQVFRGSFFVPPQVCGNTIQATIETGEHARIEISEDTVSAAQRLVTHVFASVVRDIQRQRSRFGDC